jgi:preprotein translocase subunit SecY
MQKCFQDRRHKFFPFNNKKNFTKSILLRKIFWTVFIIIALQLGNLLPLYNINQEALNKLFLRFNRKNNLLQVLNMYTGSRGNILLSPFSLGIIPYVNSSVVLNLLTIFIPQLEKLTEEGESGRQTLFFYKKILSLIITIIQSFLLLFYLKPYFYRIDFFNFFISIILLIIGTMLLIWACNLIDTKGVGHGTSLFICTNIIVSFFTKINLSKFIFNSSLLLQFIFFILVIGLIIFLQTISLNIPLISAKQLIFLEKKNKEIKNLRFLNKSVEMEISDSGLAIRLNQAGIFPIIVASNVFSFILYFFHNYFKSNLIFSELIYYILIVGFNYFYTVIFWDPIKIAEQLKKSSISILEVFPGKDTIIYLENIVKSISLLGGILLSIILIIYELMKKIFPSGYIINQVNISSLIICIGIAFDLQKTMCSLLKEQVEIENLE